MNVDSRDGWIWLQDWGMLARKEDGSQLSGSSAVGRACLVAAHRLNCLPAMELQAVKGLPAEIFPPGRVMRI